MRKSEFKHKAKKALSNNRPGFVFYKAMQYRWKESADPQIGDEAYFFTLEDAIEYATKINCEIGFYPVVDSIFISYEDLNGVDFRQDFELAYLDDYKQYNIESETVFEGTENTGEDLEGAVVVVWNYEKHVGYARNFESVRFASAGETEASLVTGNEDRTFSSNQSVLLTAAEVKELQGEELLNAVMDELSKPGWKWNYFKNRPTKEKVEFDLNIQVE